MDQEDNEYYGPCEPVTEVVNIEHDDYAYFEPGEVIKPNDLPLLVPSRLRYEGLVPLYLASGGIAYVPIRISRGFLFAEEHQCTAIEMADGSYRCEPRDTDSFYKAYVEMLTDSSCTHPQVNVPSSFPSNIDQALKLEITIY